MPYLVNRQIVPVTGFAILLIISHVCSGFAQQTGKVNPEIRIGDALSITNKVSATDGPNTGLLSQGNKVYHNQTIETGAAAAAEFEFTDTTRFAIGEKSRIVLDNFVYDPEEPETGEIVLTAAIGSFRFVSGLVKKDRVVIKTPTSTIGIRGTAFDLHVTGEGETVLALLEGEVTVCNLQRQCRTTSTIGHLIKVAIGGILTNPAKWTGDLLNGTTFASAFPFINNQKSLGKVLKLPTETIGLFALAPGLKNGKPGPVLKKTTKNIGAATKKLTSGTKGVLGKMFKKSTRKRK